MSKDKAPRVAEYAATPAFERGTSAFDPAGWITRYEALGGVVYRSRLIGKDGSTISTGLVICEPLRTDFTTEERATDNALRAEIALDADKRRAVFEAAPERQYGEGPTPGTFVVLA